MSTPTWPNTLPTYPIPDGLSMGRQSGVLRQDMDAGPGKARTRFTARVKWPTYQYILTRAQKIILDTFYDSLGGTLPFYFSDPDSSATWTATFRAEPSYVVDGLEYRATVQLEVLP